MIFSLRSDTSWKANIDETQDAILATGIKTYLSERNYGASLQKLVIVLMCRDPVLNFKQRIRMSKVDKTLYTDIMLDLTTFEHLPQKEKETTVADTLLSEIPRIILKYKFEDFDSARFIIDFKKTISKMY